MLMLNFKNFKYYNGGRFISGTPTPDSFYGFISNHQIFEHHKRFIFIKKLD
jgi:hypothetical protein